MESLRYRSEETRKSNVALGVFLQSSSGIFLLASGRGRDGSRELVNISQYQADESAFIDSLLRPASDVNARRYFLEAQDAKHLFQHLLNETFGASFSAYASLKASEAYGWTCVASSGWTQHAWCVAESLRDMKRSYEEAPLLDSYDWQTFPTRFIRDEERWNRCMCVIAEQTSLRELLHGRRSAFFSAFDTKVSEVIKAICLSLAESSIFFSDALCGEKAVQTIDVLLELVDRVVDTVADHLNLNIVGGEFNKGVTVRYQEAFKCIVRSLTTIISSIDKTYQILGGISYFQLIAKHEELLIYLKCVVCPKLLGVWAQLVHIYCTGLFYFERTGKLLLKDQELILRLRDLNIQRQVIHSTQNDGASCLLSEITVLEYIKIIDLFQKGFVDKSDEILLIWTQIVDCLTLIAVTLVECTKEMESILRIDEIGSLEAFKNQAIEAIAVFGRDRLGEELPKDVDAALIRFSAAIYKERMSYRSAVEKVAEYYEQILGHICNLRDWPIVSTRDQIAAAILKEKAANIRKMASNLEGKVSLCFQRLKEASRMQADLEDLLQFKAGQLFKSCVIGRVGLKAVLSKKCLEHSAFWDNVAHLASVVSNMAERESIVFVKANHVPSLRVLAASKIGEDGRMRIVELLHRVRAVEEVAT